MEWLIILLNIWVIILENPYKKKTLINYKRNFFTFRNSKNCKIIYPQDVVVGKNLNGTPQIKELNEILSDEMILDIGPKTIKVINNIIDESNTILWNGPAGYFENPNFANGTVLKLLRR